MKKMIDADSDALSNAALYSAGNSNLNTTTPLGTAGWETVDQKLTTKTDEQGKPIWVFSEKMTMMVAAKNKHVAWRLRNNDHSQRRPPIPIGIMGTSKGSSVGKKSGKCKPQREPDRTRTEDFVMTSSSKPRLHSMAGPDRLIPDSSRKTQ